MNIFTVDLENGGRFPEFEDMAGELLLRERFIDNSQSLFDLLNQFGIRPTVFILGTVAEKYPQLVRELSKWCDIGTHGYDHQPVWNMSVNEFERELKVSINTIEKVIERKVVKYRAPDFSLFQKDYFKVLANTPIEVDCSLSPIKHLYGKARTGISEPYLIKCNGRMIKEFPPMPIRICKAGLGLFGGGYFRLYPYCLLSKWLKKQSDYSMLYLHPSDFDKEKPIIKGISPSRRFKSYVGLKGAEKKLRRLLNEFEFTDIEQADKMIDWTKVPIVRLQ